MAVNGEQNQQFNQNAQEKEQAPSTGGGADSFGAAAGAAPGSRIATSSTGQQAGSTGSGRFTNLQKYIGANQGAGDRLGAGITNKVSRENEGASKEANTSAGAVRDGIASAQDKLKTGNQYKSQVNSDNFNAKDLAGDDNKLKDFTNYRTGSAIDEAQLAKQNQAAQTNYQNLQNQMQTQIGQTQTDNGRFNMLKNTFGGGSVYQNPYSQGQQRLDGLLLQSDGGNQIGQLQNQLRSSVSAAGQQLGQLDTAGNTIGNIKSQESALASGLQSGIDVKTGKFVGDIEATQNDVNTQRASEQAWANQQYGNLQGGQGIDSRFAEMLGLKNGMSLNNAISDKNVNQFINYGATNLTGANQLANQDQRSYYDSLAKLQGTDAGNYQIKNDYTPEAALSTITGDASLKSTLDAARAKLAAQNNVNRPIWGGEFTTNLGDVMNQVDASKYAPSQDLLNRISSGDWNTYAPAINELTNDPFHTGIIGNIANSGAVKTGVGINNGSLMGGAAQTSVMQALRDMANGGYFNTVKVK